MNLVGLREGIAHCLHAIYSQARRWHPLLKNKTDVRVHRIRDGARDKAMGLVITAMVTFNERQESVVVKVRDSFDVYQHAREVHSALLRVNATDNARARNTAWATEDRLIADAKRFAAAVEGFVALGAA